jgi:DNA-binding XRE family transcriptional regulator
MALGISQGQIGEALGVSRRTISRWYRRNPNPSMAQLCTLARLVHPRDAALAAEIAWTASETLESLGLVVPPPPAPVLAEPSSPPLPTAHLVDSVVCAASEALGVAPSATVRVALLSALRRARELRLGLAEVEGVLAAASTKPAASA